MTMRAEALTAVDVALEDSFPASDPPPWNPGQAEAAPSVSPSEDAEAAEESTRPTWVVVAGSLASLVGLVLIAPLAIIALPIALAWRAALDVTRWRTSRA